MVCTGCICREGVRINFTCCALKMDRKVSQYQYCSTSITFPITFPPAVLILQYHNCDTFFDNKVIPFVTRIFYSFGENIHPVEAHCSNEWIIHSIWSCLQKNIYVYQKTLESGSLDDVTLFFLQCDMLVETDDISVIEPVYASYKRQECMHK